MPILNQLQNKQRYVDRNERQSNPSVKYTYHTVILQELG